MTDRELLEAAARAAGIELRWHPDGTAYADTRAPGYWGVWNPRTDDGDALRLAVKLRIDVVYFSQGVRADSTGTADYYVPYDSDPNAATRRAIVRAAAAMVKEG